jgi:hypothetical protein
MDEKTGRSPPVTDAKFRVVRLPPRTEADRARDQARARWGIALLIALLALSRGLAFLMPH